MEEKRSPKYLYKFRYFDEKNYHIKILTHNQLFFSSPSRFNDPFDSKIPVRYDDYTIPEFNEYWDSYLRESKPELNRKGRKTFIANLLKQGGFRTPKGVEQARLISERVASKVGVFSLAGDYKNILLWSHYSNSHTGFALGFNVKRLPRFLVSHGIGTGQLIIMDKVEYSREYPIINAYRLSKTERLKGQLLTKSIDWLYENEYRILLFDGANQTLTIPNGIIRRVIMGCQITDRNRENLIAILKKRIDRPSLFQAMRKKDSFALDFQYVKY